MKFEEMPFREYVMFALGAYHAQDFEEYKRQFIEIFLSQPDRLNPEDHIADDSKMVCDSRNTTNSK